MAILTGQQATGITGEASEKTITQKASIDSFSQTIDADADNGEKNKQPPQLPPTIIINRSR